MTILGTRPELIRLSRIIPKLDRHCDHVFVHTGQNFDQRLNEIFFDELAIRAPDRALEVRGATPGQIMAEVFAKCEAALLEYKPDRLLILGDTYSGLSAVIARRMGIPVFHMEAGNRCFDFRVPEETNRRVIDSISSVLMPYTERARENLLSEGASNQVYVTGNPIHEVLVHYASQIAGSKVLQALGLEPKLYLLVTVHRAENVDDPVRLAAFFEGLTRAAERFGMPVVCSVHPRTRERLKHAAIVLSQRFVLAEPFGFFDFVHLEQNAFCVVSDSGTVQEETCIFHVPNVTIRDVTERPETVECGSNVLAPAESDRLVSLIEMVTVSKCDWQVPPEYLVPDVSEIVLRILMGHRS
jgi:UDP-N-acetylglucosamine 2-epimerase (non-hydrolysing)